MSHIKFGTSVVLFLLLFCRAEAQIVCQVIESLNCPETEQKYCFESSCFFLDLWQCPSAAKEIAPTNTFVDGFRTAGQGEMGTTSITYVTNVYCQLQRACNGCSDWYFNYFNEPTADCLSGSGSWTVVGPAYWILQGNGGCTGT